METILTIKNCHRAKTVRPANQPEAPAYEFEWRKKRYGHGMFGARFNHIITAPDGTEIEISDNDLNNWVVLSWEYEESLEHLWDAAVRAFSGTSQVPEERAAQYIREYEQELHDDVVSMPENEKSAYISKYGEWVSTLFSKHSRIASAMIVGPARFPTSRNNRANSSYDTAVNEFRTWREKYLKGIQRRIEDAKPQEQKDDVEWRAIKTDIMQSAAIVFGIDTKREPYNRALIVSNLYNRMETLAKNSKVEMLRRAAELIKRLNEKFKAEGGKEVFTSRHKFWKLAEAAEAQIAKKEAMADLEDKEIEFEGGKIVFAFSENRLQIFHDSKPANDTISLLKREAWKWSRNNQCWQRQLTSNACYSAARVIFADSDTDTRTNFAKTLCHALPA